MSTRRHFSAETIVVILILTVSNVCSLHKRKSMYSLVERDVSSSNIVNITNAETAINCAIICSHTEHCQAMRYDAATAECSTMSEIPEPTHDSFENQTEKIWKQITSFNGAVNEPPINKTVACSLCHYSDLSFTVLHSRHVRMVVVVQPSKPAILYCVSRRGFSFTEHVEKFDAGFMFITLVEKDKAVTVGSRTRFMYMLNLTKRGKLLKKKYQLARPLLSIAVLDKTTLIGLYESDRHFVFDYMTYEGNVLRTVHSKISAENDEQRHISFYPGFLIKQAEQMQHRFTTFTTSAWNLESEELWSLDTDFFVSGTALDNQGDLVIVDRSGSVLKYVKPEGDRMKLTNITQLTRTYKLYGNPFIDDANNVYIGQFGQNKCYFIFVRKM